MTKAWIKTTLILYVLWILLSGKFEAKFIIVGLISSAIIAKLCVSSFWIPDKKNEQTYSLLNIPVFKLIRYIVWLLVEIIKASWGVAMAVTSPNMRINPQIIEFDWNYKNPIATTMLINSIILTPGTVTLDVMNERHFVVHALTDGAAEGLLEGTMQRKIAKLFDE